MSKQNLKNGHIIFLTYFTTFSLATPSVDKIFYTFKKKDQIGCVGKRTCSSSSSKRGISLSDVLSGLEVRTRGVKTSEESSAGRGVGDDEEIMDPLPLVVRPFPASSSELDTCLKK